MKNYAILLASGLGKRVSSPTPKQFFQIGGKPLFLYSLETFIALGSFHTIILTIPTHWVNTIQSLINDYSSFSDSCKILCIPGGKERYHSVYLGLEELKKIGIKHSDNVLIHDSARPLVSKSLISKILEVLQTEEAVAPGIPLDDTLKKIDNQSYISQHLDRNQFNLIQTPQGFHFLLIYKCYQNFIKNPITITDDTQLLSPEYIKVKLIPGEKENFKITTTQDLNFFEYLVTKEKTKQ